jgi:hypothetical protein
MNLMRRPTPSIPARALAALALLALGAACATEEKAAPLPRALPAAPAGGVQSLVGDAACDSDAQCATIGIGAKACGGPSAYLAWSTLRTDGEALRAAAEREATAQRNAQAARGMVSNCAVTPDPGAWCELKPSRTGTGPAGVCRLRSGGAGGNPLIR